MLPKWHILYGAIFSALAYFTLNVSLFNASLIFLASVFIDVDHYIWLLKRNKTFSLKKSYDWYKALPHNHKPIMHIFHTIEFFVVIFLLSYLWQGFLFILIGLLFHNFLDIIQMVYDNELSGREFILIRYILSKDKSKYL